jgi:hypothetical protein
LCVAQPQFWSNQNKNNSARGVTNLWQEERSYRRFTNFFKKATEAKIASSIELLSLNVE